MKKFYALTLLLMAFIMAPTNGKSQCKPFAKKVCEKELTPYIHDGNYHVSILSEGETAKIYKTLDAHKNYRIYICGSENIPGIHFQVKDRNQTVIYDNKNDDYKTKWDFVPDSSQEVLISLKVDNSTKESEIPVSGCVSVMIGVKD